MLMYEILECSSWMKWPSFSASQSMLCAKIHLLFTAFKENKHYQTSPADSSNLAQKSGLLHFPLAFREWTRSEHAHLNICNWFEWSLEPLCLNLSVLEAHRLVFTNLMWDLLASCHTGDSRSSLRVCEWKVCQMSMPIYHVYGTPIWSNNCPFGLVENTLKKLWI